jgi:hypothetical protein
MTNLSYYASNVSPLFSGTLRIIKDVNFKIVNTYKIQLKN